MKFENLFEKYTESQDFLLLSEMSKKSYLVHLRRLSFLLCDADFVFDVNQPGTANNYQAFEFFKAVNAALTSIRTPSARHYSKRIFSIVWKWAERNLLVPPGYLNLIYKFKVPKPNTVAFSKEEIDRINKVKVGDAELPYKQLIQFCFMSGLRPNEAVNLRWEDIGEEFIEVKYGKGKPKGETSRLCKLTDDIKAALPERGQPADLVFISKLGRKLNKDYRSKVTRSLCEKAWVKPRAFYSTRRGTATEMFKSGKYDVYKIQNQLGHANLNTTLRYIRPTMLEKAGTFNGF